MDKLQLDILNILLENSRRSDDDIASMLGISMVEVETAIKKMIEDGVIRRFSTVVNENLIQGFPIKALVELSIRPEKIQVMIQLLTRLLVFRKLFLIIWYLANMTFYWLLKVKIIRILHILFLISWQQLTM